MDIDYKFYSTPSGRMTRRLVHKKRRLSKSERLLLINKQAGLCFYCTDNLKWIENGDPDDLNKDPKWATIDHKIPWVLGGKTDLENCVVACRSCNISKGARK